MFGWPSDAPGSRAAGAMRGGPSGAGAPQPEPEGSPHVARAVFDDGCPVDEQRAICRQMIDDELVAVRREVQEGFRAMKEEIWAQLGAEIWAQLGAVPSPAPPSPRDDVPVLTGRVALLETSLAQLRARLEEVQKDIRLSTRAGSTAVTEGTETAAEAKVAATSPEVEVIDQFEGEGEGDLTGRAENEMARARARASVSSIRASSSRAMARASLLSWANMASRASSSSFRAGAEADEVQPESDDPTPERAWHHLKPVTPEMLDCGDMYELSDSVWDVMCFFAHDSVGSLNTCVLGVLFIVNLALQAMFIFLIDAVMMDSAPISAELLDGLIKFRLGLAHSAEYADKVTQRSMAAQVCNFDRKLHLAGDQVDVISALTAFVDGGLSAKALICFVQILWLCTILRDFENTHSIFRAIRKIGHGKHTRLLLADLREADLGDENVGSVSSEEGAPNANAERQLRADSLSDSELPRAPTPSGLREDPANQLIGFMSVVRIATMTNSRKFLIVLAVCLPKAALALALYIIGAMWLATTINFADLILNGVALAFVLDFDEVLYSTFIPRRTKTLITQLEPLPLRREHPGTRWAGVNSVLLFLLVIFSMLIVWHVLLQHIFWQLEQGHSIMCSGNQDFIYAVNPATKMVLVANTTGENIYTDTEEVIAQVSKIAIQENELWDGLVPESIFAASVSAFARAVDVTTASDSFDQVVSMSVLSIAEAVRMLPCRDLASGQSQDASVKALQVLMGDTNISNCSDIPRVYCAYRDNTWLRAICPSHCRCGETLLTNTGFFQQPAFGCPSQCQAFKAATNEIDFRFQLIKLESQRGREQRREEQRHQDENENQRLRAGGSGPGGRRLGGAGGQSSQRRTAEEGVRLSASDTEGGVSDQQAFNETDFISYFEGCSDFAVADFSFAGGCSDSNGETQADKNGNDCSVYTSYPSTCGFADDDDFEAAAYCCACGGGHENVSSSLDCYESFDEACWRLPQKALTFLLYVRGLFEYSLTTPGFRDSVANVVEMDYAGIAPDEDTQIELIEHIATGGMGRGLASGSWDLAPGLPHPRNLTGCDFLASYEVRSLLNIDLCDDGGVHSPLRFLCPVACGCDESNGLDECPASCVLQGCYEASASCAHVHPWYSDECIAGFHNDGGLPTCFECTDGETRRRRSTSCTECSEGYYDMGNLDDCVQCLDGQTRRRRSTFCTDCDPGTYDAGDADDCAPCVGGATRRRRAASCTDCPDGTYKPEDSISDDCEPCLSCYTTRRRSSVCSDCDAGHYNDGSSDDCMRCQGGETRRRRGAVECTACPAGKYNDGDYDDCQDVACPEHSDADGTVVDGCQCDSGYIGMIRPASAWPYYSGACAKIPVHTKDSGYCQWPIVADKELCSSAAQSLGLTESESVDDTDEELEVLGCTEARRRTRGAHSQGLPRMNAAGEFPCQSDHVCICLGYGNESTCADAETSTGCPPTDSWADWVDFCYNGDSADSCCGCNGGTYTGRLYELCLDTNGNATSDAQEESDLTGCLKWDWHPWTCEWAVYYDDTDFSPADMCCACGGGYRWTETVSSTTSVTFSTTPHTTTASSITPHSTTATTASSATTTRWYAAVSGACTASDGCVRSPNYPDDYVADDECLISLAYSAVNLSATSFSTERSYDKLTINGERYSGGGYPDLDSVLPAVIEVTGDITWTSDFSITSGGWELCLYAA